MANPDTRYFLCINGSSDHPIWPAIWSEDGSKLYWSGQGNDYQYKVQPGSQVLVDINSLPPMPKEDTIVMLGCFIQSITAPAQDKVNTKRWVKTNGSTATGTLTGGGDLWAFAVNPVNTSTVAVAAAKSSLFQPDIPGIAKLLRIIADLIDPLYC